VSKPYAESDDQSSKSNGSKLDGFASTCLTMSSLLQFFCLTYILSWACFIAAAKAPTELAAARTPLFFLGTFAPALVAIGFTGRCGGRRAVLELLSQILRWRVGIQWYVFALTYMAVIKLLVAVTYRLATSEWPGFRHEAWFVILAAIVLSTPVQAGEEIGWRGYALPRLYARLGLGRASLVLGVIWACWHLPFFFIPGADKSGQSFPLYLLQVTALSVAAAWLYWRTRASLLLVMLMHSAVNQTIGIVPSAAPRTSGIFSFNASLVAWLTVALLSIGAGYFLAQMREPQFPSGPSAASAS
jgi:membrane protease YdiL (CAAX protease family)